MAAPETPPITWQFIRRTFATKERTRDLLAPELEQSLTLADFERAINFLPGSHRYWPNILGLASSVAAATYGNLRPKPWAFGKTTLVCGLAGFAGASLGLFLDLRAHTEFMNSLENQRGFRQALANVNTKLEGPTPVSRSQEADIQGDNIMHTHTPDSQASARTNTSGSPESLATHSRWHEIRAANTRHAGRTSSWDALRQGHERSQITASAEEASFSTENDRAREQAQFDAMLEAERRKSRN